MLMTVDYALSRRELHNQKKDVPVSTHRYLIRTCQSNSVQISNNLLASTCSLCCAKEYGKRLILLYNITNPLSFRTSNN